MAKAANILIIILELLGFRVSIGDRKWKIFAYYTQISNLVTLASSLVYVITGEVAWLRYTSACMLTMTFMVTLFILVPFGGGFRRLFIASLFWKKLQTFLENVASPFWRNVHLHGATYAAPWKQTFFVKSY